MAFRPISSLTKLRVQTLTHFWGKNIFSNEFAAESKILTWTVRKFYRSNCGKSFKLIQRTPRFWIKSKSEWILFNEELKHKLSILQQNRECIGGGGHLIRWLNVKLLWIFRCICGCWQDTRAKLAVLGKGLAWVQPSQRQRVTSKKFNETKSWKTTKWVQSGAKQQLQAFGGRKEENGSKMGGKKQKKQNLKTVFWHFRWFSAHALGFLVLGFKNGRNSYKKRFIFTKIVELT